ncbi:hypothetical protein ACET3Z_010623 [Daucus carota]
MLISFSMTLPRGFDLQKKACIPFNGISQNTWERLRGSLDVPQFRADDFFAFVYTWMEEESPLEVRAARDDDECVQIPLKTQKVTAGDKSSDAANLAGKAVTKIDEEDWLLSLSTATYVMADGPVRACKQGERVEGLHYPATNDSAVTEAHTQHILQRYHHHLIKMKLMITRDNHRRHKHLKGEQNIQYGTNQGTSGKFATTNSQSADSQNSRNTQAFRCNIMGAPANYIN